MNTKNMINTLMMTAGLMYGINNCAIAQTDKQNNPIISADIGTGVHSKFIPITGKPLSEYSVFQISGTMNIGSIGLYSEISADKTAIKEIDLGLSYQKKFQTKFGKITAKIIAERKSFTDKNKEMYLSDLILVADTKVGNLNLRYRERFDTKDYNSGRIIGLTATTPTLNLGNIAEMTLGLKGQVTTVYHNKFIDTSTGFLYITPGINLSLKNGNTTIETFLKYQNSFVNALNNHMYGGITLKHHLGK